MSPAIDSRPTVHSNIPMAEYEIIPEPQPRSRLGRPKVATLAGRLIHELERKIVLSDRDRAKLAKLSSLLEHLLRDDEELQID